MRRHGWGGSPPTSEHEARERILDAAVRCLDRDGASHTNLSDVAAELGVARPTIYRYFPGRDDLLSAVTERAHRAFKGELQSRFANIREPAEYVVEVVAYVVEQLPRSPHLAVLLATGRTQRFERDAVSTSAVARNVSLLRRDLDWAAIGYAEHQLGELVEIMHRMIVSLIVAPPDNPRSGPELRDFLRRWFGPKLAPQSAAQGRASEPTVASKIG
ncbi:MULTISPECIES: TetR/AcrR family transcriptional regulator [Parafrankia]|nr:MULTISPECIES: TetR/AcrR family transcriptional regulator [Parafrankia]MBE3199678.1 TetR/AcrR family transcriptional regulator [Parafrankia sp. CH37]